jgi:hypothetical protein
VSDRTAVTISVYAGLVIVLYASGWHTWPSLLFAIPYALLAWVLA